MWPGVLRCVDHPWTTGYRTKMTYSCHRSRLLLWVLVAPACGPAASPGPGGNGHPENQTSDTGIDVIPAADSGNEEEPGRDGCEDTVVLPTDMGGAVCLVVYSIDQEVDGTIEAHRIFGYDQDHRQVEYWGNENCMLNYHIQTRFGADGWLNFQDYDDDVDGVVDSQRTWTYEEGSVIQAHDSNLDGTADYLWTFSYTTLPPILADRFRGFEKVTWEYIYSDFSAAWGYLLKTDHDADGRVDDTTEYTWLTTDGMVEESRIPWFEEGWSRVGYVYDEAGRVLEKRSIYLSEGEPYVVTWLWNDDGTVAGTRTTNQGGTLSASSSYTYDADGRPNQYDVDSDGDGVTDYRTTIVDGCR